MGFLMPWTGIFSFETIENESARLREFVQQHQQAMHSSWKPHIWKFNMSHRLIPLQTQSGSLVLASFASSISSSSPLFHLRVSPNIWDPFPTSSTWIPTHGTQFLGSTHLSNSSRLVPFGLLLTKHIRLGIHKKEGYLVYSSQDWRSTAVRFQLVHF